MWISNHHRYAVVVQDLTTQWIQSHPCKTQSSQESEKSSQKFRAVRKAKSHLFWQFLGVWQRMWRSILESSNINTSPFQNKWYCWKSGAQSKRRNVSCTVCNRAWMNNGGRILWNACATCEMSKISWRMGQLLVEGDSEKHFEGPVFPFGAMVEYYPISSRYQSKLHSIRQECFTWNIPRVCIDRGENSGRWHSGRWHWWIGKHGRVRNQCSNNQCKRSNYAKKEVQLSFSQSQMEQPNCLEERRRPRIHSEAGTTCEEWRISEKNFQETRKGPNRQTKQKMTLKPAMSSGQSNWISFIVITSNLEFKSTCRKKNHSQYHWNAWTWPGLRTRIWTCCRKAVQTTVGMSMRIQVCQIHGQDSRCSQYWARNLLKEKRCPGGDLQRFRQLPGLKFGPKWEEQFRKRRSRDGLLKSQSSTTLDAWEAFVSSIRKMESARKPSKYARKRWEIPMEAAMSCKMGTKKRPSKLRETDSETKESNNIQKTKRASIVEAHDSTRKRLESTLPKDHEDHIAGQGYNSMTHYNLVHKFIPVPFAMKIPDAKAAVNKEWEKREKLPAWQLNKVKSKKEVILEAQRDTEKVHFATSMDICPSQKKRGVGTNISEVQRTSRAPRWHCERRFGFLCCIHRTGLVCVSNDRSTSMSLQGHVTVQDKQPTQCQLTPQNGGRS